jgi:hypothetical protein
MAQTNDVGGMPYHYSFANDVLVIVVDQTATDNSRLKLAYFKAPDYKLFWVDHNFNLANSRLGNASSVLYIYEGGEPPDAYGSIGMGCKTSQVYLFGYVAPQQIVGRERRERVSQLTWCGAGCFDSRRRVNSDVRAHRSLKDRQTSARLGARG